MTPEPYGPPPGAGTPNLEGAEGAALMPPPWPVVDLTEPSASPAVPATSALPPIEPIIEGLPGPVSTGALLSSAWVPLNVGSPTPPDAPSADTPQPTPPDTPPANPPVFPASLSTPVPPAYSPVFPTPQTTPTPPAFAPVFPAQPATPAPPAFAPAFPAQPATPAPAAAFPASLSTPAPPAYTPVFPTPQATPAPPTYPPVAPPPFPASLPTPTPVSTPAPAPTPGSASSPTGGAPEADLTAPADETQTTTVAVVPPGHLGGPVPAAIPVAPPITPLGAPLAPAPEPTAVLPVAGRPAVVAPADGVDPQAARDARARALGVIAPTPDVVTAPTLFQLPTTYNKFPSLVLFCLRVVVGALMGVRVWLDIRPLGDTVALWQNTVLPDAYARPAAYTQIGLEAAICLLLLAGLGTRVAGLLIVVLSTAWLTFILWGAVPIFDNAGFGVAFTGEYELLLAAVGLLFLGVGG
ncbi:MAG: hypothetical protein LBS56_04260, partial [Propionibacteriaceae bacterium]|nr:hypothetical protein [Propionibacteriaceae bacterium]